MDAAGRLRPSPPGALLTRMRPLRARRLSDREVRMEVGSGVLLAAAVAALAVAFGAREAPGVLDVAGLVLLAAVCSGIHLHVGGGSSVPTQLALVPMLFLLPPAGVPLAMAVALGGRAALAALRGRAHPHRVLSAAGDAWHAVGPALVFGLAGMPEPGAWTVIVPALAAQVLFDATSGLAREWIAGGSRPRVRLRVRAAVHGLDVLLTPVGLLAVAAPVAGHHGWVLTACVAAVLAGLAVDRSARIEQEAARADELRRERARLQSVLRRLGAAVAAGLDAEAMLAAVRETAGEALDAELTFAGVPRGRLGYDAGNRLLGLAADQAAAGALSTAVEGDWHALACGLGRCGSEVLAVARRGAPFSSDEVEVLHHLAAHAAVSLENAQLHARLHEQATVDELTGLANHRVLQSVLADHLTGERFAPRVGFVLIDIDDFKRVNDTCGHLAGDQVLRDVAQTLRARCRASDCLARYGGEELALVLPRTDREGALRAAEDLRAAVEALEVRTAGGRTLRLTVSAGVATSPDDGTMPRELVAAADEALYEAKRAGKNRVVAAAVPAHVI